MYRITIMSGKFYAVKIDLSNTEKQTKREIEEIETFTSEGTPIILVNELEDLEELGIDVDDVLMVERE
jgi:collagenase-like PrtC family protease